MAGRDRRNDRLTCRRCGAIKGRNAFRLTGAGNPRRVCRQCENTAARDRDEARARREAHTLVATKPCARCGEEKPLPEYGRRMGRSYNRSAQCRACLSVTSRAARHGVTAEWIESTVLRQAGCCLICGEPAHLRIDHDHETGRVRGMICHNCNAGLGHFRDSPDALMAAAAYLLQHENVLLTARGE